MMRLAIIRAVVDPRRFDFTERLSRFGAMLLFVSAVSIASVNVAAEEVDDWERNAEALVATADVVRGGGESAAGDDTSFEKVELVPSEQPSSFALSVPTRAGRSCSTLVLQNDE